MSRWWCKPGEDKKTQVAVMEEKTVLMARLQDSFCPRSNFRSVVVSKLKDDSAGGTDRAAQKICERLSSATIVGAVAIHHGESTSGPATLPFFPISVFRNQVLLIWCSRPQARWHSSTRMTHRRNQQRPVAFPPVTTQQRRTIAKLQYRLSDINWVFRRLLHRV